eukprot:2930043-Amphidinium_carterae.3
MAAVLFEKGSVESGIARSIQNPTPKKDSILCFGTKNGLLLKHLLADSLLPDVLPLEGGSETMSEQIVVARCNYYFSCWKRACVLVAVLCALKLNSLQVLAVRSIAMSPVSTIIPHEEVSKLEGKITSLDGEGSLKLECLFIELGKSVVGNSSLGRSLQQHLVLSNMGKDESKRAANGSTAGKSKAGDKPVPQRAVKRLKVDFTGVKFCELCKASAKDFTAQTTQEPFRERETSTYCDVLTLREAIHQDGAEWALYSEDVGGNRHPQGEQCKRCFLVWSQAFQQYSWQELVESKDKEPINKQLEKAFAVHAGEDDGNWDSSEIMKQTWVGLEIKRDVILLSERDMRRDSGLEPLPKKHLKSIPSFSVMKEDGSGVETVYAFKDESSPYRRGCMKVMQGTSLNQWLLESDKVLFPSQAETSFPHFNGVVAATLGSHDFLDKEGRGNLHLSCWESFLQEKLLGDKEEEAGHGDGAEGMSNLLHEAEVKLIGPAAAAATAASATSTFTPEGKAKKNSPGSLSRPASSHSLDVGDSACTDLAALETASTVASLDLGSMAEAEYTGV